MSSPKSLLTATALDLAERSEKLMERMVQSAVQVALMRAAKAALVAAEKTAPHSSRLVLERLSSALDHESHRPVPDPRDAQGVGI